MIEERMSGLEINIYGTKNKRTVNRIAEAIQFFANILIPGDIVDELTIDVDYAPPKSPGHCVAEDDSYREFSITVSEPEMINMIAHEMVHVSQYVCGELYSILTMDDDGVFTTNSVYKGVPWIPALGEKEAFDSPWEIIAYGKEVGLSHRWKMRNRKKKHND